MNAPLIARNLLRLQQAGTLAESCRNAGIPIILLKGIALIACVPAYLAVRSMDDLDVLVPPASLPPLRALLAAEGYQPLPEDPWAYQRPGAPAPVDLHEGLWYLSTRENAALVAASRQFPVEEMPGAFHLPPVEFYVHVLTHAAVHHAMREERWLKDLEVLRERWGDTLEECLIEEKLRLYGMNVAAQLFRAPNANIGWRGALYRRIATSSHPLKGHLSRFLCLPFRRKAVYLWQTLFPSAEFIRSRYSARTPIVVFRHRLCRPLYLLHSTLQVATAMIFAQIGAFLCLLKRKRHDTGW